MMIYMDPRSFSVVDEVVFWVIRISFVFPQLLVRWISNIYDSGISLCVACSYHFVHFSMWLSFSLCILNTNPLLGPLQIPSRRLFLSSVLSLVSLLLLKNSSGLPAPPASFIGYLSCAWHCTECYACFVLFNHHSRPVREGYCYSHVCWGWEVKKPAHVVQGKRQLGPRPRTSVL